MLPYYPARDGYPSMFEADEDAGSAIGATELHQPFVDRLASRLPVRRVRERLRSALPKHCYWPSQAETRIAKQAETRVAKEESAIPGNSTVRSGWFAGACDEDVL